MSGDYSDAEAVLAVLDGWYSRRINSRYKSFAAKQVLQSITAAADALKDEAETEEEAEESIKALRDDFARTFPLRAWIYPLEGFPQQNGYFSHHFYRFEGYANHTVIGGGDTDTMSLRTMGPVLDAHKMVFDLIKRLRRDACGAPAASLDDGTVSHEFSRTFRELGGFVDFCTSYLRTRMMNAEVRAKYLPDGEPEARARNFERVEATVSYFAMQVIDDLVH